MAQASMTNTTKTTNGELSVGRIRLVTVIGLILAWEVFAGVGSIGILYGDVIPHIWVILAAVFEEIISAGFYRDLGITFAEHIVGFIVGSAVAVLLGIWMGTNEVFAGRLNPT